MTPDATTVIAYTTGLFAFTCVIVLLSGFPGTGPMSRIGYGLPFACAATAGFILTLPATWLPGLWMGRLGAFFIVLAYGTAWQAARLLQGRRRLPLAVLLPCLGWLALSSLIHDAHPGPLLVVSATVRALLIAAFNGLAAREFSHGRDAQLPAARILLRIFACFAGVSLVRSPFVAWLPAPLGALPSTLWSVISYNLLATTQALGIVAFMIALFREQVAARNYRMAYQDALTGIGNRRAFEARLAGYGESPGDHPLALIIFDIDRFKSINDQHGHACGDQVISRAAEVASRILRRTGEVFRIGGEEFACLVEDTNEQQALALAERLREGFEREARRIDGILVSATISVGVATQRPRAGDPLQLLPRADEALYMAKRGGRNRTVMTDPLPQ